MNKTTRRAAGLAGLALTLCAAHASAQYVVLDAHGAGTLRAGTILAPTQTIVLPAQGWVRIMGRDVKPVMLKGPLQGRAGALVGSVGPPRVEPSLLDHLAMVVTQPLVVRGGAGEGGAYTAIDVLAAGHQCALGKPVTLKRPHTAGVASVELRHLETGQRARLNWDAARPTLPWPEAVAMVDGAQYDVEVTARAHNGRLRRNAAQFTLNVRPGIEPNDAAEALSVLLDAGCNSQALRLVHSLDDDRIP